MLTHKEGGQKLNYPEKLAELERSGQQRLNSLQHLLKVEDFNSPIDFNPFDLFKLYAYDPDYCESVKETLLSLSDEEGRYCRRSRKTSDYDDQMQFFMREDVPNKYYNPHYFWAVNFLRSYFSLFKVKPEKASDEQSIRELLSTVSSSSGWDSVMYPGMNHKRDFFATEEGAKMSEQFKTKQGCLEFYYHYGLHKAKERGSWREPTICFKRTQTSINWEDLSFKRKRRLVQCVGLRQTIQARQFLKPVDRITSCMPMFGPGRNESEIGSKLLEMQSEACSSWTLDYSKFDSTIPAWLLSDAFTVMKELFDPSDIDEAEWNLMVHDFIHKDIVSYDGVYPVHHGTASGHPATTAINCIVNSLMTLTWAHKFKLRIAFNVFGDDNVVCTLNRHVPYWEFEDICDYLTRMFGITCNASKCKYNFYADEEYLEYLSRTWKPEGAWRDHREIIDHMLFPERWREYYGLQQPWIVVYSYILATPAAMRELMDVDRFMRDFGVSLTTIEENRELWKDLPYNIRLEFEAKIDKRMRLMTIPAAEYQWDEMLRQDKYWEEYST